MSCRYFIMNIIYYILPFEKQQPRCFQTFHINNILIVFVSQVDSTCHNGLSADCCIDVGPSLKINLNASKPSNQSKCLGWNIDCRVVVQSGAVTGEFDLGLVNLRPLLAQYSVT